MSDGPIRELLAAYVLALDADEIDECLQLFTEDAEFEVYGRTFVGRNGIAVMFRAAPRGLHLLGAARIDVTGDSGATARSQLLFIGASDQDRRSAIYDDEAICQGGRWMFRRRRCRFITSAGLRNKPEVASV